MYTTYEGGGVRCSLSREGGHELGQVVTDRVPYTYTGSF
jgi:hypothetical protein